MIYTLEYIKKEAELISGHWNGDEKFVDGSGEQRTEEDAAIAGDILEKVNELEVLIKLLGI